MTAYDQFKPRTPKRKYVSGETHFYIGKQYRLKPVEGLDEGVKLKGAFFVVTVQNRKNYARIQELLDQWYRDRAESKLRERYAALLPKFKRLIRTAPPLLLRHMKKRWGSHSRAGRITLNIDLIRAPSPCIDYVIAHELAHVIHSNHGKSFYELLNAVMSDWEKRKMRLERMLA